MNSTKTKIKELKQAPACCNSRRFWKFPEKTRLFSASLGRELNAAALIRVQKLAEAVGLFLQDRALEGYGLANGVGGGSLEQAGGGRQGQAQFIAAGHDIVGRQSKLVADALRQTATLEEHISVGQVQDARARPYTLAGSP